MKPGFIVVEGPIGVGKTSLARRLAATYGCDLILEDACENPFLERFYSNPRQAALSTQLFFLLQRAQQLQDLRQGDIFSPVRVADYMIEKDHLFAELNLDDDELCLYEKVYQHLTLETPHPDLVIYLQAPADILLQRVSRRGRHYEQLIESVYLQRVVEAYTRFFYNYSLAPLLIVNASKFDPIDDEEDYQSLLARVNEIDHGRHYFNPVAFSF